MKQPALFLTLVVAVIMLASPSLLAQNFVIPVNALDDSSGSRTIAFGILTTANPCTDTADHYLGYQEFEQPPVPPPNVVDMRFDDRTFAVNGPCNGQGSLVDFRPAVGVGQKDSFYVKIQPVAPPLHLSWPSGLNAYATSLKIVDAISMGSLFTVDMFTLTNFDVPGGHTAFFILMDPLITPNTPFYMTSLDPDSVFNEDPLKPGKSKKGIKRFKGLGLPNWTNLLNEVVAQGGYAPLTSESDIAGGMVVGTSWMFDAGGKYKPIKDSAKVRFWFRGSKWVAAKNLGKSAGDIQKTLRDKTGKHIGIARGYDSTGNPGDLKRKILKGQKKLTPKTQSNRLFAEMVALKVNIAASQLGKTPEGFGDLLYSRAGHPYDGRSIIQISAHLDSVMTYWEPIGPNGGGEWDSAYNALYEINRAFLGTLDTASWETGGDTAKLVVAGNVDVNTIPFLEVPTPFVPTRIAVQNNLWDAPDDFEDQDPEEVDGVPTAMKLYQNYPNPFNPATTIAFRLLEASNVSIKVYDILGQEVATLLQNEEMDEGFQAVDFSSSGLASGVYFYRVEAQNVETGENILPVVGKMMLLK